MDRKSFIKRIALGSAAALSLPLLGKKAPEAESSSTYDRLMQQVGFNHLPPHSKSKAMKSIIHKAESRGHANHGWLDTHHSFSFANYYNPERMHFGVLRVLNDDSVAAGRGFGTHPHDNMEIISIPLEGDLEHKDSMGNTAVIKEGDVQVMSAGTGVFHSEYNRNKNKDVKFLQIWVFPNTKDVQPRYDQISLNELKKPNEFYQILSPNADDQGVWIHQNAWFHMADLDAGVNTSYQLKGEGTGVYAFVLDGQLEMAGEKLSKRDGMGVWETNELRVQAETKSRLLLMEVPMGI
jgi:redox-sensitive bicupin YhaK (pirin superfamily)